MKLTTMGKVSGLVLISRAYIEPSKQYYTVISFSYIHKTIRTATQTTSNSTLHIYAYTSHYSWQLCWISRSYCIPVNNTVLIWVSANLSSETHDSLSIVLYLTWKPLAYDIVTSFTITKQLRNLFLDIV